jgi:hypothetical protein
MRRKGIVACAKSAGAGENFINWAVSPADQSSILLVEAEKLIPSAKPIPDPEPLSVDLCAAS